MIAHQIRGLGLALGLLLAALPLLAQEAAPAADTPAEAPPQIDRTSEINPDQLKPVEVKNAAGLVIRSYFVYEDSHGRTIKHGLYQEFYDSGAKSREATYDHGLPNGRERWWHPNGQRWKDFTTVMGVREGTYQEWSPNGKRKKLLVYRQGRIVSR